MKGWDTSWVAVCLGRATLILLFLGGCQGAIAGEWDSPARYLFTASFGSQQLTVIDTRENTILEQLVLRHPIDEIAVSAFGNHAYVGHGDQKALSVIDLSEGAYSHSLIVPVAPRNMTSDSYAGLLITDSMAGGMARVDISGRKVIFHNNQIPAANDVVLSPSGMVVFWVSGASGEMGAVSVEDGRELWRHKIAEKPVLVNSLVRSLDGLYIVATLPDEGRLIVLDASSGKLLLRKKFGGGLQRPYVTANGQYFLIPENSSRQLHIYSQVTLQHIDSLTLPAKTPLVAAGLFDIVGLGYGESTVFAFDLLEPHAKDPTPIALPGQAADVIVTSDSLHAYAAIPEANGIAYVSLKSGEMELIEGVHSPDLVEMGVTNAVCH